MIILILKYSKEKNQNSEMWLLWSQLNCIDKNRKTTPSSTITFPVKGFMDKYRNVTLLPTRE